MTNCSETKPVSVSPGRTRYPVYKILHSPARQKETRGSNTSPCRYKAEVATVLKKKKAMIVVLQHNGMTPL